MRFGIRNKLLLSFAIICAIIISAGSLSIVQVNHLYISSKHIGKDLMTDDAVMQADLEPWMDALHDPPGRWHLVMDLVDLREASAKFEADWKAAGETPLDRQEVDSIEIEVTAISPSVGFASVTCQNRRWYYTNGDVDRGDTAETWVFVLTEDGWKLHSGQSALFPIEE